jgi:hypothetical protein
MGSDPLPSLSFATRRELIERAAPFYREASLAQKGVLLDQVMAMTGYTRKYAIRLLNHLCESKRRITRQRLPRYGSEVRQALLLAWRAMNYFCVKRLIPFLPTLLPVLERHGYLQLTEEQRSQMLQISTPTAERLLHSHRSPAPPSLSLTQAGPLLKQQISIRTFSQWDDAQPGFVEADLVAHHGGDTHGCFLSTLTLTDVATGWTECFPLLYKSPEAVLMGLQQARQCFPFPILGLDTDNGSEFINEAVMRYCEAEQITFTRGRPEVKNDQCFVEQKNGAVVRHFVRHGRLVGSQAARQLRELYRALRLYVNCFQPSMKLVSKHVEEGTVRRVYDPAKTPLERLLLSGILPDATNQHLREVAQALDPIRLFAQMEQLQQALWRWVVTPFPLIPITSTAAIVPFCVERCLPEGYFPEEKGTAAPSVRPWLQDYPQPERAMLDWSRTIKDPFEGEWDLILSLVLAHPDWSGRTLFQELQRQLPGRYQPSQLSTLQVGLRKIRARSVELGEEYLAARSHPSRCGSS